VDTSFPSALEEAYNGAPVGSLVLPAYIGGANPAGHARKYSLADVAGLTHSSCQTHLALLL
jgi:hypothetical protein